MLETREKAMNDERWTWCVERLMAVYGYDVDTARGIALERVIDLGLQAFEREQAELDDALLSSIGPDFLEDNELGSA